MDVDRIALPGIGLQHTFTTETGQRLGVISHRSGQRDLVIYDDDDPDTSISCVQMTPEEADGLADLLGTSHIVERLAELERQVDGLVTEQIPLGTDSPFIGRTLGDTATRTRTGSSIVAVVRQGTVIASPRPDFRFQIDDVVVVVGTQHGTAAVARIFRDG
ncbi:MAG: cation:proton antiporter regulatory subunit [Corynebacteriales bacterium]|nr:cation:proton antiporter regulatory subunit [Mycobacteriales bacterium]